MTTLRDIGELAAIERLRARLPVRGDIIAGAGDDCAVVRLAADAPRDLLLTSDPVIEGVHFTSATPLEAVGHKAMGRLLSDIAAMGGEPLWALINVAAPASTPASSIEKIYDGALALGKRHGLAVVGGDMAAGPVLELHAFAVGAVPAGQAVLRSGARPGDRLYVTGCLGGSILGKHCAFEPRIAQGRLLRGVASAMIDLSDGLATDLRHLADRSGVGAELRLSQIPVADAARQLTGARSPVEHALFDGEDFELLFAVPPDREAALLKTWGAVFELSCTAIGVMTALTGTLECVAEDGRRIPLAHTGFQHFAPSP
jgi:thiamine-monophosphate kinase